MRPLTPEERKKDANSTLYEPPAAPIPTSPVQEREGTTQMEHETPGLSTSKDKEVREAVTTWYYEDTLSLDKFVAKASTKGYEKTSENLAEKTPGPDVHSWITL
jgi:hypothetical protein